jgi:hypothetical protein
MHLKNGDGARIIFRNTTGLHLHVALTSMATVHTDMSTDIFYSAIQCLSLGPWQPTGGSTVAFRKYRLAMAQEVSYAQVSHRGGLGFFRASPCEICGGQVGTGTDLSSSTFVFPS